MFKSCSRHIGYSLCERSSVVEHHLAGESGGVAGSKPRRSLVRGRGGGTGRRTGLKILRRVTFVPVAIPVLGSIHFNITMHPWLNWIEYLTTNQAVAGSNPAGCIISGSSFFQLGRALGLGPRVSEVRILSSGCWITRNSQRPLKTEQYEPNVPGYGSNLSKKR